MSFEPVEIDQDRRDRADRRRRLRNALRRNGPVVLYAYPHSHNAGYTVYAVFVEGSESVRLYACELSDQPLPDGLTHTDIFATIEPYEDPEPSVQAWLALAFPGASLTNVRVERVTRDAHAVNFDLSSCDAVGDSGCTDPDCWRCHSPLRPENLRTLADNLATAAMLFFAWQLRAVCPAWQPGCGDRPRLPSLMEAAIASPRVGTFLRKRSA